MRVKSPNDAQFPPMKHKEEADLRCRVQTYAISDKEQDIPGITETVPSQHL